jgi:3-oxoacyl-[acyl-carrier protein] reductase
VTNSRETAVVSGAAQGIGLAIARRLGEAGFRVLALDRNGERMAQSAAALRGEGHDATGFGADVTDRAAIARVLASAPGIDVAVCAAGVYWPRSFDEATEDDFRRTMEVNVIGVFVLAQEAVRRMKAGGRVIAISSRGALGGTGFPHYVASKAAVIGLVRAMAMELRGRQIAVNSIAPGFTDTPMTRTMPPDQWEAAAKLEFRGRPADPAEIAESVAFLASPRTAFITGQTIFVDGGKSLGGLGL